MDKQVQANKIVSDHVVWSLGAGLMPIPLFDIAAVTAVQMDMLKQLSDLFEVDYSKSAGKAFVSALTGSTFASGSSSAISPSATSSASAATVIAARMTNRTMGQSASSSRSRRSCSAGVSGATAIRRRPWRRR